MMKRFGIALLLIMAMAMSFGCAKKQVAVTPENASGSTAVVEASADNNGGSMDMSSQATEGQLAEEMAAAAVVMADAPIYFDFDKFDIKAEYRTVLKHNAMMLQKYPMMRVLIEGHTDSRGTSEYNLALGERRARAVQDYLIVLGVPATQLEIVSYGEERAAVQGASEAAWAKNRRAEFKLIK
ncbi:peptidoglycan-associated lipoprotein Pal [Halodesulfovibrio aestuarii]|uniref:Peptidoglycan-associated lipoprotein n=1 Tax=Halodesulfovibrio aestuarii TaxID=126333 RepID=A0A8G2CAW2_9BACT|nr:peptidoglycan-associated lipoprotein Pal [Halodesulfovibrio aestuarii]SHJ40928.1 peptidoglycan-associated lipoprotein [Halodesulfovibrio aestuarii]